MSISVSVLLYGCGSKTVKRLESDVKIDLSGRWNEEDSSLVSEKIIDEVLSSAWYRNFRDKYSRKPVVIVGRVQNRTMEHINVNTFIKDIERAMLNSGEIEIVASAEQRREIRDERQDMQRWASVETIKKPGKETGADFMLNGILSSIVDEEGGRRVVYYQADMNLVNIETNRVIWAGQKRIRKFIRRPLFAF